jgi:hypothetical protein
MLTLIALHVTRVALSRRFALDRNENVSWFFRTAENEVDFSVTFNVVGEKVCKSRANALAALAQHTHTRGLHILMKYW